jgi:hypothetical protein
MKPSDRRSNTFLMRFSISRVMIVWFEGSGNANTRLYVTTNTGKYSPNLGKNCFAHEFWGFLGQFLGLPYFFAWSKTFEPCKQIISSFMALINVHG